MHRFGLLTLVVPLLSLPGAHRTSAGALGPASIGPSAAAAYRAPGEASGGPAVGARPGPAGGAPGLAGEAHPGPVGGPLGLAGDAHAVDGALVAVTDPRETTAAMLLDRGIAVVRDMGGYLLVVVPGDPAERLGRLGLSYEVLDLDTVGKTYYTVELRDGARRWARGPRVLKLDRHSAVIAASPREAQVVSEAGFEIARVFLRPIRTPQVVRPGRTHVPPQPNDRVETMVAAVSGPTIDAYVQRLQDFRTRLAIHDSCQAAAEYIKSQFESFGIDSVFFHHFNDFFKDNVVAVKPGLLRPERIVLLGGHYDSRSNNPDIAPGADDNASGTACVLECARVLSGYSFDYTLVFVAFGAEEQGLFGSEIYASEAAVRGDEIIAMINADMIGYLAPGDVMDLDIISNPSSVWLRERVMDVASLYVPQFSVVAGALPPNATSDHASFWAHGYDAILLHEDTGSRSPYLHTMVDVVGVSYNAPALAENTTRVAVALAADLAGPYQGHGPFPDVIPAIRDLPSIPNPLNPSTTIRFTVDPPARGVTLRIYDVAGRRVRTLLDGEPVVGPRAVQWDGTDNRGRQVPSGVYFYRLEGAGQALSRKLVVIR